jgi:DNA-binding transcriptional LysR family regulator
MDLRQLRVFIAVARERHFGRAAEGLRIAQPAVSQHVRALEADLGARLFERTSRSVELTPAGRTLLDGAPAILESVERLAEATRATARALRGELRVNYTRTAPVGIATDIVEEFRRRHPEITLTIDTATTARNIEALRAGSVDAAFVRLPLQEAADLSVIEVGTDALVAALPSRHRLARRRLVRPAELARERIIFWPRAQGPGFHDLIIERVFGATAPNIVRIEPDTEHMVRAVAAGHGCAITTQSRASLLSVRGVVFRTFTEPQPAAPLALAWRAAGLSPPLRRLIAVARELARRTTGSSSALCAPSGLATARRA